MLSENPLIRDQEIKLPDFIVLKASAGTGKTHALTLRFTQFLLSDSERIKHNQPREVLAITFTRNAAREMKTRIINWLKACYFHRTEQIAEILELVTIPEEKLKDRAEQVLGKILSYYCDFQVSTIDSFMADVFKASAIDLGFSPDFEITLDSTPVISYAFSRFMRKVKPDTTEGQLMLETVRKLKELRDSQAKFFWDPSDEIRDKFNELYHKLEAANRRPLIKDLRQAELELSAASDIFKKSFQRLKQAIEKSGLDLNKNSSYYSRQDIADPGQWLSCSFKTLPVKKIKGASEGHWQKISEAWLSLENSLNIYKATYSRNYFQSYLQVYRELLDLVKDTKKERALVLLEDVHCQLANYLEQDIVPDIYFSLGTRIYHYLIDEFQDTSPLQWKNLEPLIENALAQGGSLLVVGDTKQAIYGFREADYRIMVDIINQRITFPPVKTTIKDLNVNRRSRKEILNFVSRIFPEGIKTLKLKDEKFSHLIEAATMSGLDDFECQPLVKNLPVDNHPGYVELELIPPEGHQVSAPDRESEESPELQEEIESDQEGRVKQRLQNLIEELRGKRGYRYSELAILTYRNETVAEISAWLNEKRIPFVPFSSLDIRKRPVVREIMALLQFLDFPLDDLNFTVFLCGRIFQAQLHHDGLTFRVEDLREFIRECRQQPQTRDSSLYTIFRTTYPKLWEAYFEIFLKTVGYLPLYDLISHIYRIFNLFHLFPEDQAALIKLLEVIKDFEGRGKSNLRDFLSFSEGPADDQSIWTVDVPPEHEAVKIMTIHKAKGLDFPVVILLLKPQPFIGPVFYINEKNGSGAEVLKLNDKLSTASPELEEIYHSYRLKEEVNRLNTLYVALTRAKQEFYLIGLPGKKKSYPFDLLEALELTSYKSAPTKPERIISQPEKPEELPLLEITPARPLTPPIGQPVGNYQEIKLGRLLHSILAEIEYLESDLDRRLSELVTKTIFREYQPAEINLAQRIIKTFLLQPEVVEYFRRKPGRKVFREMELASKSGFLYRADRVVIDPELVTVIDFKSSRPKETEIKEAYNRQLKNYVNILRDIYPESKMAGWLMYLEPGIMEQIL
ncbi:MAG: UvrD-helicase domain-containing protein [Acidobacteriota bacterium]|nr:UvrD-helicase domain-containing protein [Acidobacteriota bacterium]MDW3229620.1 UvrD-helicase domain-containing protein [Acidobacteriota bacterium]MDY0231111.1 UvrD-helicase domain-containing protein [Candidatus Saccharicenans sp.]